MHFIVASWPSERDSDPPINCPFPAYIDSIISKCSHIIIVIILC